MSGRMPCLFLSHGGGPWPWFDMVGMPDDLAAALREDGAPMRQWLETLPSRLPEVPRAMLVISAHWEEPVPTLQTHPRPPLLHDYGGYPEDAFQLQWPAPGAPAVAEEVRDALLAAGIESATDGARGYDSGTFVVTKLMYPDPPIPPTLQLSITDDLDVERARAIGHALSGLRDRGVLLVGSGYNFHNMAAFGDAMAGTPPEELAGSFTDWLVETVRSPADDRMRRLVKWEQAPGARYAHPREDHLMPLLVVAAATSDDDEVETFRRPVGGIDVLQVVFGS